MALRYAAVALVGGSAVALGGCGDTRSGTPTLTAGSAAGGGNAGGDAPVPKAENPPQCPESEPEAGASCEPSTQCHYPACRDGVTSIWDCREGTWRALRTCDAECPETRPAPFSDCTSYWLMTCAYVEAACGTEQSVSAHCDSGTWLLYGPSREDASPACQLSYPDGAECELPDGCTALTCYSISCYGQPLVRECVDGKWRVQTSCSK